MPIDPVSLLGSVFEISNSEGTRLSALLPPQDTMVKIPAALRDTLGRQVFDRDRSLLLERIPFSAIYAELVNSQVAIPLWGVSTLSPGEVIRVQFAGVINQETIEGNLLRNAHRYAPDPSGNSRRESAPVNLRWENDHTLLFSLSDASVRVVKVSSDVPEDIYWTFFVAPLHRLVILSDRREIITEVDLPLSTMGPIGMSEEYGKIRLARAALNNAIHYGSSEYIFDIETGRVEFPEVVYSAHGLEAYATLDMGRAIHLAAMNLRRQIECLGLSNDGDRVSVYGGGEVVVTAINTGEKLRFPVPSRIMSLSGYGVPEPMFWSIGDNRILYGGFSESTGWGTYILDLAAGSETLLAPHILVSASPFSEHLLTARNDVDKRELYILDYSGKQMRLDVPGERVILTKWIDQNRALINKIPSDVYDGFFPNSQCFIYHLDENRWEYVAKGYGFDYDVCTGRVFLLQER